MYKLGFRPQEYNKGLYFDGHERPDVVEARKKYIENYAMLRKRLRMYDTQTFEHSLLVEPENLDGLKEKVFIYHDESTIHASERPKSTWLLPGSSKIWSKNSGQLIYISGFTLETTGRLKLSDEQLQNAHNANTMIPESADAATVI